MKDLALLLSVITLIQCSSPKENKETPTVDRTQLPYVPEWAQNVIWYQIFVERFRNGDTSNDPTLADIQKTYPENIPEGWKLSEWGKDWYVEEDYMANIKDDLDFYSKIQLRRFGGDLQGVLDKIDYISDLGVTAIYFNPLNDSPSLHKYDARNWRHIDRNFGPDPKGDAKIMNEETPDDPTTWEMTAADKLFLELVKTFHERGIRIIMDYSWNHAGYDFWAVNDLRDKGKESKYTDWFAIEEFDDPETPENETKIEGWWGFKFMPVVKEDISDPENSVPNEGNVTSPTIKQHIFNITQRWLDPNGDGDFEDGVDGFRLDVAAEMTKGFWRDYRKFVKSVNPDAYLVGEIWWLNWPKELMGPEQMVQGDIFDAVMNYRWYRIARGYFSQGMPALKPSEFVEQYQTIEANISIENQRAMMNITATHDTPRLSTCFFNDGQYKYHVKLNEDSLYKVHRPDEHTWKEVKMLLLHQFSFVGSPHIWNGDEMGMWGADDPDCRKPLWWDDIDFEPEQARAFKERSTPADTISINSELLGYYKKVISIRKENPVLAYGELEFIEANDEKMTLAYSRKSEEKEAIALFNRSEQDQKIEVDATAKTYANALTGEVYNVTNGKVSVDLSGIEGMILISQ
ncbi:MAG: alpha-amylase [Cytophagales bacterium]|nr:alpha-amylase [Cytophagales bacterium]